MTSQLEEYVEQVASGSVLIDLETIEHLARHNNVVAHIWELQNSHLSVQEMLILMVKVLAIINKDMTQELLLVNLSRPVVVKRDNEPDMTFHPPKPMTIKDTKKYDSPLLDD